MKMSPTRHLAYALCATVLFTGGCDLYSNDDCYEVCNDAPDIGYEGRNPDTGQCEYWGGGGGGGCYTYCEGDYDLLPATRQGLTEPLPDWPACYSQCEGRTESQCQETDGCQAVYLDGRGGQSYYDCWATGYNDPANRQDCGELDSWSCTRRDDCSRVHTRDDVVTSGESDPEVGFFQECINEGSATTGCYTDADCDDGYDCTAETECLEPPGCDTGGECPAVCYGRCVPDNPWGTCDDALCERLPPNCPAGTVPGVKNGCFTDYCIPDGLQCGDEGPAGQCFVEPSCDSIGPDCPEGTLPGIANGCFTGFCVPYSGCEAPPACSSLNTEALCLAASTCVPLYEGENCSCDGTDCTCESYTFTDCIGPQP
ncbi:MAG: hypothetical protein KJO07_20630 [Deltaproteobacteria bacterium]|nr:hypothetical protein [Deltaproteobacteria bacterium]